MPCIGPSTLLCIEPNKVCPDPPDPASGKVGAGAHTDWGSFTLLCTDDTPGLRIWFQGNWLGVPPKRNCFIINTGDQIARLAHNHYRSALHRVVTPKNITKPRYSTAFFTYFGIHARVGPLPRFVGEDNKTPTAVTPTTFEYFHYKLHQSMGVTKATTPPVTTEQ